MTKDNTLKMRADICLIDLETNGEDYPDVRITQIGAVFLEATTLKEKAHFNMYVDGRPLSPKSIEITGITEAMLEGKPKFHEVGKPFSGWAYGVGQDFIPSSWGTHFDIPVLRWEYAMNKMKFGLPGKSFCVKSMFSAFCWMREVPIYRCSVNTALKILGLEFEGKPHDALDDARNEARILRVALGVEPPGPKAQIKFGRILKSEGAVPFAGLGPDDEKSPYD